MYHTGLKTESMVIRYLGATSRGTMEINDDCPMNTVYSELAIARQSALLCIGQKLESRQESRKDSQ